MSRDPEIVRGTVQRILDDGSSPGSPWRAVVLRTVKGWGNQPGFVATSQVDQDDDRLPKDTVQRVLVTLKDAPRAREGDDIILYGTVSPDADGKIHRFTSALPADGIAYRASPGRRPPPDLAKLASDHLRTVKGAEAITVLRGETHSDPAVDEAIRRVNDSSVDMYRPQAVLVMDIAAVRSPKGNGANTLHHSLPKGMAESHREMFSQLANDDNAAVLPMGSGEASSVGSVISPAVFVTPTIRSMSLIAGIFDSSMTPREGGSIRVQRKWTTMHELAHAHEIGFGVKSDPARMPTMAQSRRSESFADAAATAAMILDGEDPHEVEKLVMAREAIGIRGATTHTSGLAARRAFELAMRHVERHGIPKDGKGYVSMRRIMTMARKVSDQCAMAHDSDLEVIKEAVLKRAGALGRDTAEKTAEHVLGALADLRSDPTRLREPGKAFATMEAAAAAIGRSMWTARDLMAPEVAARYGESARKDLFATLSDLNRKGFPREIIDEVIEKERMNTTNFLLLGVREVRQRAIAKGGMEGLVQKAVDTYLEGGAFKRFLSGLGLGSTGEDSSDRTMDYIEKRGVAGILRSCVSFLRRAGILDVNLDRDLAGMTRIPDALRHASSAAARAAGKLPESQPMPARQMDAFVAIRSAGLANPSNPWRQTLAKRIDMAGRISQQAAVVAILARQNPEQAPVLQDRFDYLMARRKGVLESLTLVEETRSSLRKNLQGRDTSSEQDRIFVSALRDQAAWEVTGKHTRLPLESGELVDALVKAAERLGHPVPKGGVSSVPPLGQKMDVPREKRGFVTRRDAEGMLHCEEDWAVEGPGGERRAYINGQKALVVRMEMPDGEMAITRLMTEKDATAMASAIGGRAEVPTLQDFEVIRREVGNRSDFLPVEPDRGRQIAIGI